MQDRKVIAIFDIGKTNKKVLLFDKTLSLVYREEKQFDTIRDEEDFECDDIEAIEYWIKETLRNLIQRDIFEIKAVNFSTHGASLAFIDQQGKRLTPLYNYLKEIPLRIQNSLFEKYGGKEEFCRKTASPPLGLLLNSGVQILWLKRTKPKVFHNVRSILHYPQYLSYLLTGKFYSEPTSVGSHTFLWDFDNDSYHPWVQDENITLPEPSENSLTERIKFAGTNLFVGIGIHDSSASLLPYIYGSKERFLLVSTGTWCITMNPFNSDPLTANELNNGCLAYLGTQRQPVKSSMLFMGHIHDVNNKRLIRHFGMNELQSRNVKFQEALIKEFLTNNGGKPVFFSMHSTISFLYSRS